MKHCALNVINYLPVVEILEFWSTQCVQVASYYVIYDYQYNGQYCKDELMEKAFWTGVKAGILKKQAQPVDFVLKLHSMNSK